MKIGIFGSGVVGRTFAAKLAAAGNSVVLGTRDPAATAAKVTSDQGATPVETFAQWLGQHPGVKLATFADAARHGEILLNVTNGMGTLSALGLAGAEAMGEKVLLDISNPLDFSKGMPPSLFISNTDSLGEQIQKTFPKVKVVKTLNTLNCFLMVDPGQLAGADHTAFVSGNDAPAKAKVISHLKEWFGWKDIIDLGDITTARGTEMLLPVWIRLWGALGHANFNFKITR